jgi:hypothetical protein
VFWDGVFWGVFVAAWACGEWNDQIGWGQLHRPLGIGFFPDGTWKNFETNVPVGDKY